MKKILSVFLIGLSMASFADDGTTVAPATTSAPAKVSNYNPKVASPSVANTSAGNVGVSNILNNIEKANEEKAKKKGGDGLGFAIEADFIGFDYTALVGADDIGVASMMGLNWNFGFKLPKVPVFLDFNLSWWYTAQNYSDDYGVGFGDYQKIKSNPDMYDANHKDEGYSRWGETYNTGYYDRLDYDGPGKGADNFTGRMGGSIRFMKPKKLGPIIMMTGVGITAGYLMNIPFYQATDVYNYSGRSVWSDGWHGDTENGFGDLDVRDGWDLALELPVYLGFKLGMLEIYAAVNFRIGFAMLYPDNTNIGKYNDMTYSWWNENPKPDTVFEFSAQLNFGLRFWL